jgi:DNA-binding transcriptional MerR regulator
MPDHSRVKAELPPIPAKRYFTIGEVSDLCAVKPHVLRYWEQEFTQLKPVKRRGNRRYYQHHEVLLIRRIRDLLYEQGFTINGARHRLESDVGAHAVAAPDTNWHAAREGESSSIDIALRSPSLWGDPGKAIDLVEIRQELEEIRQLLGHDG